MYGVIIMFNLFIVIGVIIMALAVLLRNEKTARIMYAKHFEFSRKVFGITRLDIKKISMFQSKWLLISSILFIIIGVLRLYGLTSEECLKLLESYVPLGIALSYLFIYFYTNFSSRFRQNN